MKEQKVVVQVELVRSNRRSLSLPRMMTMVGQQLLLLLVVCPNVQCFQYNTKQQQQFYYYSNNNDHHQKQLTLQQISLLSSRMSSCSTRRRTCLTILQQQSSPRRRSGSSRSDGDGRNNNNNNNSNDETLNTNNLYDRPVTSFGSEAVPENQRPVNEYLDVTSQPFFDWANTSNGTVGLLVRLFVLYNILFWLVCYPIAGATYTIDGYEVQKLACANVGSISVILALIIRLYSGWYYLGQRLTSTVIEYEETGWYDGNYEEKTIIEIKRDRFLYNTNVKPVVERLTKFLYSTILSCIVSVIVCNIVTTAKPLPFDQYNPDILERLSYDEKLALSAAEATNGRPAYCNSRYYQAIANGGQGCN